MRDHTGSMEDDLLLPLSIEGLRLEVEGQLLLDGIDLTLASRDITVVMGANGAGKSLFLRVLHGLVEPGSGRISWAGRPNSAATRHAQAMVFQKPVLLRRSVAANIDFVLRARGGPNPRRRDALLSHVGLLSQARQPARALSGGEQQRLAVARALATDPSVLMMDEPTASLDPASTASIEAIVLGARDAGTKVIFVTHDIGQARRIADEVVFLHRGRVAEHARAEQFFAEPSSEAARAYLAGRLLL
ncbi:MAG: ATP-binding cassette domain-containing protein [Pseudomonadota bacterium]